MMIRLCGKGSETMFPRFSVNRYLVIFSLLGGLFYPCVSHAQLLTGFDDAPVFEIDPKEDILKAPLLTGEPVLGEPVVVLNLSDNDISVSENQYKTNTYKGFLTSHSNNVFVQDPEKEPLDIEANTMRFNNEERVAVAEGDVIIVQDGRILRADEAQYFIDDDRVRANGNVVLNEETGNIYLAQDVEYSSKLKNGSVEDLRVILADGSRFAAVSGVREEGKRTVMESARYTACDPCQKDPSKSPPWQIVASEVKHDEEDARISYRNARFNVYGVPVAYTPYFSHPDGTINRKSGFLAPSFGFKSELGAFIENQYYWSIAPDKDATFGLLAMTEQAPLGLLEYRQRWQDASIQFNGGVTYSDRTSDSDDQNFKEDEEVRGHVFATGLWDLNDQWRTGFGVEYVSDDQYARQYDITDEDVLQNTVYAERFSGRHYAIGLAQLYKDIRVSELEEDQPGVLPEIYASFVGAPDSVPVVGGRWDASVGFLSLFRDGSDQDVVRASVDLGWKRHLVSDYGLVSDFDLTLRGDAFHVNDGDATTTTSGRESSSVETRFFPQLHIQTSYPLARQFEKSQLTVEPLVAFTLAPTSEDNDDIPNEDSQDVQIDASNLFESNRFPGLDVVEDQSRVTYGVRTGINGFNQSNAEMFIGQSYRLDEDNNPFQNGSGLEERSSDVVGSIKIDYDQRYTTQYRFQLDNDTLASKRHELDMYADWNRFRLGASYLYAQALEGTEITENREQISSNALYYINDKWSLTTSATYDIGSSDPGLRRSALGLNYFGQCVSWSLEGNKNLTDDASGDSDVEVLFRIGLRNISEFSRSGLR
ncbi:MAG: LPS-assembly protein LptD [Bdellovibrionales bacterium]